MLIEMGEWMHHQSWAHDCLQSQVYGDVAIVLQNNWLINYACASYMAHYMAPEPWMARLTNPRIEFDYFFFSATFCKIARMNENITWNYKKCSITKQITIIPVLVHLFVRLLDFNDDNHHRVCRIWCAALMSACRSCKLHELYFLVFQDLAVSLWFLSHVESSIIPSMPPLDHSLVDVFRSSSNLSKWFLLLK